MNWNEFDLFYYIKDYKITTAVQYNGKLTSFCPSNVNTITTTKKERNMYLDYLWCDLIYDLLDNNRFKKNLEKYVDVEINEKLNTLFTLYYHIFNNILKVKENILSKSNSFITKLNNQPFVGIQVRVGNEDIREQAFSDKDDIEVMFNLLKEKFFEKTWYVTGDSQKTKKKLCEMKKNVYVYTNEKAKHYERCTTDATIIIEHEILSKSSYMVISKSTYGFTALLKSGIFLRKDYNLSYEITRRNAYDVKSNFRKITSTWHFY